MWRDAVVAYFNALFLHLAGENEKTTINYR
jgi:hypothetical protein